MPQRIVGLMTDPGLAEGLVGAVSSELADRLSRAAAGPRGHCRSGRACPQAAGSQWVGLRPGSDGSACLPATLTPPWALRARRGPAGG